MAAKLGILAGGGALPGRLARAAHGAGREVVIVAFQGHTEPATVEGLPHLWTRFGAAAEIFAFLRREQVVELVFAGPVRRPALSEILPDWQAAKILAKIGSRSLGDDGLLRAVSNSLESEGFRVVGIHEILTDLLAPAGRLGRHAPDATAEADINRGVEVVTVLGRLDVGQAAVVQQGLVLGVEGIEGTDALIARCGSLRRAGPGGVLVKLKKPQQDRRLDLPTIGVTTVKGAAAAGLRGIAVEAGSALIIDRADAIAAADRLGLFLVGVAGGEAGPGAKGPSERDGAGPSASPGPPPLTLFVIAGEPSGDVLGARLIGALKARAAAEGRPLRLLGVGGPRMVAEGLQTLFPMADLALMGVFELLPRLPRLIRRLGQTVAAIRDLTPDAVITIDAPGFSFRVGRRLRAGRHAVRGVPLIHYVAPTVWAWRPERARKIAAFLDHLLVILPFEPPWFEREGLACTFVGHSIIESGADRGDGAAFRARHGLTATDRLIAVLPGSRTTELKRLLPDFAATLARIVPDHPGLVAVVPAVAHLADRVRAAVAGWPLRTIVVEGDAEKYDAFAAAEAALAASGTVALELALAGLPSVIAYRLNALSVALYRRLIKTKYVNLVNIMHDRMVVPELLQEHCTPDRLATALTRLLDDSGARAAQIEALSTVDRWLGAGGPPPSERAAAAVWQIATQPRGERP
ncbi:MAG: lipid-A-disaccharide synthase [Rhodospirillaceae bacterium]